MTIRRHLPPRALACWLLLGVFAVLGAAPTPAAAETLTYGRFGKVTLYQQTPHPKEVVLFFSGDGGWNLGVIDMATTLSKMGALVVGIDLPHYLKQLAAGKEKCSYPASDVEMLSKYVQKKLAFPTYTPPVLVGYSSGATLVYALLVEAPPNTFKGSISMGFCPDLPLTKPMCAGHGLTWGPGPKGKGYSFKPTATLEQPWIAFQGLIDQVCSPTDVEAYVKQVKNGTAVMLPKVGHGFSVTPRWEPQFKEAFQRLTAAPKAAAAQPAPAATPASPAAARGSLPGVPGGGAIGGPVPAVADLPLVEVPAKAGVVPAAGAGDLLAVVISGDGGWAGIDREVADQLAARGVPVIGLNALQYFWTSRTPDGMAGDLQRIARHYLSVWNRRQLLLVGYSLGADVLPFMASRLPADLQARVRLIALLGPSRRTSFEFHLTEWVGGGDSPGDQAVLPEVAKLRGKPLLCLYGQDEKDSLCTEIGTLGKAVSFEGSHHFGGAYASLADRILREVQPAPAPATATVGHR